MIDKVEFQKEQDALLTTILEHRFFQPWKEQTFEQDSLKEDSKLEIFITNSCNKKCEYCYLQKHLDLYPKEYSDFQNIKNNLRIFLNYLIEKEYKIPTIELFSGEIWHTDFGLEILQMFYDFSQRGLFLNTIIIPSNCSFVSSPYFLHQIQNFIDNFKEKGIQLIFSISTDGEIVEQTSRPYNNKIIDDKEHWDNIFAFAKHNNFYFHPMVSSFNVSKWIENYNWFEDKMNEYDLDINNLMMLEVRDNNWSTDNIKDYCNFMKHLIERFINRDCRNNSNLFFDQLFSVRTARGNFKLNGYVPFCFPEADDFIGCTCATNLTVRLGDLAVAPCHRLAYNKYLYGKFVVENDKIIGLKAINPQAAIKVLFTNFKEGSLGCDTCLFKDYCLKGCFGNQYEIHGDPFIVDKQVCHFFKQKYSFLLKLYTSMGIEDYLNNFSPLEVDYLTIKKFKKFYQNWSENYNGLGQ